MTTALAAATMTVAHLRRACRDDDRRPIPVPRPRLALGGRGRLPARPVAVLPPVRAETALRPLVQPGAGDARRGAHPALGPATRHRRAVRRPAARRRLRRGAVVLP